MKCRISDCYNIYLMHQSTQLFTTKKMKTVNNSSKLVATILWEAICRPLLS